MQTKFENEEKLTEADVAPMTNPTNPSEVPAAKPAEPQEVQQAALDIPEGTEGSLVGENSVVTPEPATTEGEADKDGYVTATAEILIPSEALNRAGAMETGDTGDPVETMPNPTAPVVEAPEGSVVQEVQPIAAEELQPTLESIKNSLTEDDLRMILEYRKYKDNTNKMEESTEETESESSILQEAKDLIKNNNKIKEAVQSAKVVHCDPEKLEGSILQEAKDLINKNKLKEADETDEKDPIESNFPDPEPFNEGEDEVDEENKDPEENDNKEPKEALNFDNLEVDDSEVDDIFNDSEINEKDFDELLGEDEVDTDKLEDYLDDDISIEDVPEALRTSADYLDFVLDGRDEENEVTADKHDVESDGDDEDTLDFENIPEGGIDEDTDEPEEEQKEEEEDPFHESTRSKRHLSENYVNYSKRFKEASNSNGIWYPPVAKEDTESAIQQAKKSEEENLVRDYQNHVREQKKALSSFRKKLTENRNRNVAQDNLASNSNKSGRFGEALRGSNKSTRINESTDSWIDNTFIEKYNESSKLDFKKLLEDGFLG